MAYDTADSRRGSGLVARPGRSGRANGTRIGNNVLFPLPTHSDRVYRVDTLTVLNGGRPHRPIIL